MRYITILLIFLVTINSSKAVVLVGPSGQNIDCPYQTIQAAIDSGDPEIRVVNDGEYVENLSISHSVSITGGYANCFAALLNQPTEGAKSVVNGSFAAGLPAININGIGSLNNILRNLTIKNAIDTQFIDGGHGIDLNNSTGTLTIENTLILGNTAENGGGIYIGNPIGNLSVSISNSSVFGNSASDLGGGIYCGGASTFIRVANQSYVGENMADNGGGIAAVNGCTVTVDSGIDVLNSQDLRGVMNNTSTNNGGGIYLEGSELFLEGNIYSILNFGNSTFPVTVSKNSADSAGGGIYAKDNSTIQITDGQISMNSSANNGAGIYLGIDSELTMKSSGRNCWQDGKCSVISHNTAGKTRLGGAIYVSANSIATIENTTIYSNRAGFGSVFYGLDLDDNERASIKLDGNYIYNNAENESDGYGDQLLLRANGNIDVNIIHNTIAGNDINDSSTIIGVSGDVDLDIKNSIIDNQDELILTTVGSDFNVSTECLLVNEDGTITGSPLGIFAVGYVDANNNDYRLAAQSSAIDVCGNANGTSADSENQDRGWDDPSINNVLGAFDAGADESYLSDIIFSNHFE